MCSKYSHYNFAKCNTWYSLWLGKQRSHFACFIISPWLFEQEIWDLTSNSTLMMSLHWRECIQFFEIKQLTTHHGHCMDLCTDANNGNLETVWPNGLKSEGSRALNPPPPLPQDGYVWDGPRFNSSISCKIWPSAHHPINWLRFKIFVSLFQCPKISAALLSWLLLLFILFKVPMK